MLSYSLIFILMQFIWNACKNYTTYSISTLKLKKPIDQRRNEKKASKMSLVSRVYPAELINAEEAVNLLTRSAVCGNGKVSFI